MNKNSFQKGGTSNHFLRQGITSPIRMEFRRLPEISAPPIHGPETQHRATDALSAAMGVATATTGIALFAMLIWSSVVLMQQYSAVDFLMMTAGR